MSFNSYEDLMQAVEERRKDQLVLEIDLSNEYSHEHEQAKAELKQATAMKALTGEQQFLSDNLEKLKAKVEATRPEAKPIWVRFRRLPLMEWAILTKQVGSAPIDQYEKVLSKTFVGVFNSPDAEEPISTDTALLSTKGDKGILPGGAMHSVVQAFMSWQNSGGEVNIHPTKSGQD